MGVPEIADEPASTDASQGGSADYHMTNNDYLKVAVSAAQASGKIFKKYFGRAKDVQIKGGNSSDLVTEVDKRIEKLIRQKIKTNFPVHKIVGEEFGRDKISNGDLFWVIDPIDGTSNYVYGIPMCCISIGLWDNQGPLAAVVFNPVLNQMYTSLRGNGAKLNGKSIKVGKAKTLATAMGTVGWGKEKKEAELIFSKYVQHCFKLRIFASGAWQMCMVASGNTDFYASLNENLWDFGAAALIVTEAGGKLTDIKGKKITSGTHSMIASNGKIHSQLLKAMR